MRKFSFNKLHFSSEVAFRCFICLFWVRYTIFQYALQFYKMIPFIGNYHEHVFTLLIVTLLYFSIPYIVKKVKVTELFFYIICVVVVLMTAMIVPDNAEYILDKWYDILIVGIPMIFIGVAYDHKKTEKVLYYASLLSVVFSLAYQTYKITLGQVLLTDNMDTSYKLLPSVMVLLYMMFERTTPQTIIAAILGIILSLSFGTRGPLLVAFVFVLLSLYFKVIYSKSWWIKAFFSLCGAGVVYVMTNYVLLTKIMQFFLYFFERLGFSVRIFEMYLDGNLIEDSGRETLAGVIINAIKERPIFGYGLMGDRVILGRYAHNIILELLCAFGIILGTLIVLLLVFLFVRALLKQRGTPAFGFLLSMICFVFIKLLLSGSFVYDQYFYLVLGFCICAIRTPYAEINEINQTKIEEAL